MKGISPNFGHICVWVHRCADYILGSEINVAAGYDSETLWTPYLKTN